MLIRLCFVLSVCVNLAFAQVGETKAIPSFVELNISGPNSVHVGSDLWFTAALTNRSVQLIAVPSVSSQGWQYMVGGWWRIVDKSGKQLRFKPPTDVRFDNNIGAKTLHDSDFVLLKPGETIEYKHETLGDPSDKFIFPRRGTYFVSLSWHFCAPKVKAGDNGTVGYVCGITHALSPSMKDAVLTTPSFDVQSNSWRIKIE
jgi:hypothetical protein